LPKAYVLFSCESGSDNYIVSNLKTIETVREAYGTFGTYDVIAKMESYSEDKLQEIITKEIRRIPITAKEFRILKCIFRQSV